MKALLVAVPCSLALLFAGGAATAPAPVPLTEVVVTLSSPSLASAYASGILPRSAGSSGKRLVLGSRVASGYIDRLGGTQTLVARRITTSIPGATVRWRYRVVADGLAVALPKSEVPLLGEVPGVARVYPSYRYRPLQVGAPSNVVAIGAPALWGSDLATAGQGIKIGIIDEGIDQTHPYFDPAGYTYPPGFPKGNTAYTTPKVIVARAFPPPGLKYANASLPFDPIYSDHGTHVAGIAAGNAGTIAEVGGTEHTLSGVAPRAYLGNYKALTIPTNGFGLDGNSPEIVAAIEAAVSDGMNVINLSIGEPEIDPRNDIVAKALDAASDAGVVVAVAAGNEFIENGKGSVDSPGSAASAITVGASNTAAAGKIGIADFSSSGPTPLGHLLKPDVTAPGINILSSVPRREGTWDYDTGTSMSTPHVAGAAALLRQLHPAWTVEQIKSALTLSADPVTSSAGREVSPLLQGGGRVDLSAANQTTAFASPSSLGFGLVRRGFSVTKAVQMTVAGDETGTCQVEVDRSDTTPGASISLPESVTVPGSLPVVVHARATAKDGDLDGWITLACTGRTLRIPFWMHVAVSHLSAKRRFPLSRPGVYDGNTKRKTALVGRYLYPERAPDVRGFLKGPEQVFRISLGRSHQNLGVAVVSEANGVSVTPRVVSDDNSDELTGLTALPINVNPYSDNYDQTEPVAGALRPGPGTYDIVFDTPSRAAAGKFRFRFWIDDTTPPRLRVLSRKEGLLTLQISDRGSGVDPTSIEATSSGRQLGVAFDSHSGKAIVNVQSLGPGRHTIFVSASDRQESKNDENAGRLLPNTATLQVSVSVPRSS
jgi:subtilisin family serine protease